MENRGNDPRTSTDAESDKKKVSFSLPNDDATAASTAETVSDKNSSGAEHITQAPDATEKRVSGGDSNPSQNTKNTLKYSIVEQKGLVDRRLFRYRQKRQMGILVRSG